MKPERRTREQRQRDRAAGVDRFGRPLPRAAGTNPRALAAGGSPARAKPRGDRPGRSARLAAAYARRCPICGAEPTAPCLFPDGSHRRLVHTGRFPE